MPIIRLSLLVLLLTCTQIKGENVAGPSSFGGDIKMEGPDDEDDDDEEDEDMEEVS